MSETHSLDGDTSAGIRLRSRFQPRHHLAVPHLDNSPLSCLSSRVQKSARTRQCKNGGGEGRSRGKGGRVGGGGGSALMGVAQSSPGETWLGPCLRPQALHQDSGSQRVPAAGTEGGKERPGRDPGAGNPGNGRSRSCRTGAGRLSAVFSPSSCFCVFLGGGSSPSPHFPLPRLLFLLLPLVSLFLLLLLIAPFFLLLSSPEHDHPVSIDRQTDSAQWRGGTPVQCGWSPGLGHGM